MNPEEIILEDINKLFEYEKQSRVIDQMNNDELKKFAKLYCKLYLKQQEAVLSLMNL
jgi:putative heme iron utilization protein